MQTRSFSLALIIAVIAMLMVQTYIDDEKSKLIGLYGKQGPVLVAKVDIDELELIDDSKVYTKNIPEKFQSPGHFKSEKEVKNTIATVPIKKGEQITKPRVTYPGAKTGLSRQVALGKRAMAISISENQAVGHLIKPGDRVDILVPVDYASGRKDIQKLTTILQDVLVLSTGFNMTNSIPMIGLKTESEIRKLNLNTVNKYNTITLELTPFQAQKLAFMLTYSGFRPIMSLRNNNDKEILSIKPTRLFDVLGKEEASDAKSYFEEKYSRRPANRGRR